LAYHLGTSHTSPILAFTLLTSFFAATLPHQTPPPAQLHPAALCRHFTLCSLHLAALDLDHRHRFLFLAPLSVLGDFFPAVLGARADPGINSEYRYQSIHWPNTSSMTSLKLCNNMLHRTYLCNARALPSHTWGPRLVGGSKYPSYSNESNPFRRLFTYLKRCCRQFGTHSSSL
jgi:hypothetical protein